MKNSFLLLLLLISFGSMAQKDTTITSSKVVKIGDRFYLEQTKTTINYQEFNTDLIETIDRKDDDERHIKQSIERENKALLINNSEKKESYKHLKEAIRQGYRPEINNSREQEVFDKVLKKIRIQAVD